jgi:tetratricopeptide (TPR) repeat protein
MPQPIIATPPQSPRQTLGLVAFVLVCAAGMMFLSWRMENNRSQADLTLEDQPLYGSDTTLRRASLGFNGIVADWYWMRSLQYVGRKVLRNNELGKELPLDDLRSLNLRQLHPMLERITTLDPHFIAAYEYGGIILPGIDAQQAIQFLQKGIDNNPEKWRLYHHLGYIYWKNKEYVKASEIYGKGAKVSGAPAWMEALSARLQATGGSRDTAREIYRRMMQEAEDPEIRKMAELRLAEVDSFDERDAIRQALSQFQKSRNRCPSNWRELQNELRAARRPNGKPLFFNGAGEPLDPSDAPYYLKADGCDVILGKGTKIPVQEY